MMMIILEWSVHHLVNVIFLWSVDHYYLETRIMNNDGVIILLVLKNGLEN